MSTLLNCLFLLLGMLLAAGPAVAQRSPAIARLDRQAVAQATPDTAAAVLSVAVPDTATAIHRLFAARRKRRNIIAYIAAGAAIGGSIAVLTGPAGFFNREVYVKTYAIMATGSIGIDFLASESSRKREQKLIEAFYAHQLPDYIRYELKPKYFR